jgi:uncharacterized YccA/Bax inhibitor family protein
MFRDNLTERGSQNTLDGGFIERAGEGPMTVSGAVNKSFILGAIMLVTAVFAYGQTMGGSALAPAMIWGGAIGGLAMVLFMSFKPHLSPTLAPIYAGLEGLFVGAISAQYAYFFDGIIFQAVSATMAVFFMMLFLFKSGIVKVTNKLRAGVFMATGAIALVYVLAIVLSFFGVSVPYLHQGGPIGIGISVVIIGVASLNLLLDFDNFEKFAAHGAPKYMEWYSAMGLLVTLVWLYIEILRLLAILSSND